MRPTDPAPDHKHQPGSAPPGARARSWLSHGLEALVAEHPELAQSDAPPTEALFDVVIVGSGYGAAVAAAGLAGRRYASGAALRVCVLERGREYLAGSFPSRLSELPGHLRYASPAATRAGGVPEGLFDLRLGPDANVLLANGLGGGSLINAGVMATPHPSVLAEARWPAAIRRDAQALLAGADAMRTRLGAQAARPSPKTGVMQRLAQHELTFKVLPITVATGAGPNHANSLLSACIQCGDCTTGCNHNAKDSLDLNLLRQAAEAGVQIFTGASVLRLQRPRQVNPHDAGNRDDWLLRITHTEGHARRRQGPPYTLRARRVILAAGALGSTEILLNSANEGLRFSQALGRNFSINGDMIAAAHRLAVPVQAVARDTLAPAQRGVGATITSMIDLRNGDPQTDVVIQDLAVPAALRRLYEDSFTLADVLGRLADGDGRDHSASSPGLDDAAINPEDIDRSLVVAMIGRDAADGELRRPEAALLSPASAAADHPDGLLQVHWPTLKLDPRFAAHHAALEARRSQAGLGGRVLANPMWKPLTPQLEQVFGAQRGALLTVHPLGGCAMGETLHSGVVDDRGRVFNAAAHSTFERFHAGLFVLDGAIVPTSLGINPALTIALLAERALAEWQTPGGWLHACPQGVAAPLAERTRPFFAKPSLDPEPERPTLIQVTEQMRGCIFLQNDDPGATGHTLELTLTFEPVAVHELMQSALTGAANQRTMQLQAARGRLRLLKCPPPATGDEPADSDIELVAQVSGSMHLFGLEASGPGLRRWRAFWAWLRNRGWRDMAQGALRALRRWQGDEGPAEQAFDLRLYVTQMWHLLSRAGAVRRLDYEFKIDSVSLASGSAGPASAYVGQRFSGHKRFTYSPASNPWQQLQDLELEGFVRQQSRSLWAFIKALPLARTNRALFKARYCKPPQLHFNPGYSARIGVPLLRVVQQQDRPAALMDMASFALYTARVALQVHALSFRKPDPPRARAPQRLPGVLRGLPAPQIDWLDVWPDRIGTPVLVRLARYRSRDAAPSSAQPPVLLIHGYSASGTTFAHDAIAGHLVGQLCAARRDVWVLDMRTSAGLPTATQNWRFEDMARWDIPAAIGHLRRCTGAHKVDVVAHCMGAAMFSMAVLHKGPAGDIGKKHQSDNARQRAQLHQHIGRVVLSQIGPVLQLTPANTLRADLMRYVRYFLPLQDYAFRAEPNQATLGGQVLDRVLATLPYPAEEFRLENPLWPPGAATPWASTRHRMDALYARTFSLANMPPAVLEHIDDLFGPLNMETVSQVIHLARCNAVADRQGFNRWATPSRMATQLQFPVLSLHGANNGLADVATLDRMRQAYAEAGLPHLNAGPVALRDRPPAAHAQQAQEVLALINMHQATLQSAGQGSLLTWCVPGHGHQDCLIGHQAARINGVITAFLQRPETPT